MLYRNKYRVESARLTERDYSAAGFYFFTICTDERRYFFGKIQPGAPAHLVRTGAADIADDFWHRIPGKYPFVELDEWVVMPNHVHGIIRLNPPEIDQQAITKNRGGATGTSNHMIYRQSLATVIGWYKGRVKFEATKTFPDIEFVWQPRFHDRVIRSQDELERIRQYIRENPMNWAKDELNKSDSP